MVLSRGTTDRAHSNSGNVTTDYIDAKSCILGVSSTHQDNEKTKEEGMPSDGTCENESSKAESMVDCVSEGQWLLLRNVHPLIVPLKLYMKSLVIEIHQLKTSMKS